MDTTIKGGSLGSEVGSLGSDNTGLMLRTGTGLRLLDITDNILVSRVILSLDSNGWLACSSPCKEPRVTVM